MTMPGCRASGSSNGPDDVAVGHGDRRSTSPRVPPATVGWSRSSSGAQLVQQRLGAAGGLELVDAPVAVGLDRGEQRHLRSASSSNRREDVDVAAGLDRDRLQVLDAVDRPADRQHGGDRVAEGAGGEDLAGAQPLGAPAPRSARRPARTSAHIVRAVGQHRGAAGQRHAERLGGDVHRVRRAHAGADAGAADRVDAHLGELLDASCAPRGDVAGVEEDVLEVDVLAAVDARMGW